MSKQTIYTDKAPKPVGPYSQAISIDGFLYCSGQIPINPKTNKVIDGDIKDQTLQVMKNIQAVLKAAHMSIENVIKTTIFLTDMGDFPDVNEIYLQYFFGTPPARSCVAVKALPMGVNVEIEVIAHN